jgi:trehalose 6-phosphate phosphatase
LHNIPISTSQQDEIRDALAPIVSDPASACVFSDLDGTLAPIVNTPREVSVPAQILHLVRKLEHRYLAVVVVSGRSATEARRIMGLSDLAYIGNHGFETLLPGHAVVMSDEAQPFLPAVRELTRFARSFEQTAELGILLEDKTATMSLHYRPAMDPAAAKSFILEKIVPRAEELGLNWREGRMVIEVKPPVAVDKGVAVGRMLDRLQAQRAVYIGDDATDLDALQELRRRGKKKGSVMVGIGVKSQEMPEELPKYSDLIVEKNGGVETVLQILAGEEL